jgi:NAD+ synthase
MTNFNTLSASDISDWIKKYAISNKIQSLVIGVSGGIDSALVSTLCCMTGMETHVVNMPIKQQYDQYYRAKNHIDWLKGKFKNVASHEINLTESFELLEESLKNFQTELGSANSRSRLRMTTLYHIATSVNGLVVGTGNKVEDFGVGFFTKYGDGGVDISPIGDLMKSEVKFLAKELGIIEEVLNAKPTDGLWEDDRSDEDQIGASYDELEWAMNFVETNPFYTPEDLDFITNRELQVLGIYKYMHNKNLHKMNSIPVFKKL